MNAGSLDDAIRNPTYQDPYVSSSPSSEGLLASNKKAKTAHKVKHHKKKSSDVTQGSGDSNRVTLIGDLMKTSTGTTSVADLMEVNSDEELNRLESSLNVETMKKKQKKRHKTVNLTNQAKESRRLFTAKETSSSAPAAASSSVAKASGSSALPPPVASSAPPNASQAPTQQSSVAAKVSNCASNQFQEKASELFTGDKNFKEADEKIGKIGVTLNSHSLTSVKQQVGAAITEAANVVKTETELIKSLELSCQDLEKAIQEEDKKATQPNYVNKGDKQTLTKKLQMEEFQLKAASSRLSIKERRLDQIKVHGKLVIAEKEDQIKNMLLNDNLFAGFEVRLNKLHDQALSIEDPNQKVDDLLNSVTSELKEAENIYASAKGIVDDLKKEHDQIELKMKDPATNQNEIQNLKAALVNAKAELDRLQPKLVEAKKKLDEISKAGLQTKGLLETKKTFSDASKSGVPPSPLVVSNGLLSFDENFKGTHEPAKATPKFDRESKPPHQILFKTVTQVINGKPTTIFIAEVTYEISAKGLAGNPDKKLEFTRTLHLTAENRSQANIMAERMVNYFIELAEEKSRDAGNKHFQSSDDQAHLNRMLTASNWDANHSPNFRIDLKKKTVSILDEKGKPLSHLLGTGGKKIVVDLATRTIVDSGLPERRKEFDSEEEANIFLYGSNVRSSIDKTDQAAIRERLSLLNDEINKNLKDFDIRFAELKKSSFLNRLRGVEGFTEKTEQAKADAKAFSDINEGIKFSKEDYDNLSQNLQEYYTLSNEHRSLLEAIEILGNWSDPISMTRNEFEIINANTDLLQGIPPPQLFPFTTFIDKKIIASKIDELNKKLPGLKAKLKGKAEAFEKGQAEFNDTLGELITLFNELDSARKEYQYLKKDLVPTFRDKFKGFPEPYKIITGLEARGKKIDSLFKFLRTKGVNPPPSTEPISTAWEGPAA